MNQAYLIKYGEIGIKGKNRIVFETALMRSIKRRLKPFNGEFEVKREEGRIYVLGESEVPQSRIIKALQKVFGIVAIAPMTQEKDLEVDDLITKVIENIKENYATFNKTFKVKASRARKNYPLSSMELNMLLGEKILEEFPQSKVDVHNPEVLIQVEIRSRINIFSRLYEGAKGLPQWTAGKAMLLLSGGIDSPVAGYLMAKRGVKLSAVYFHAPPYTSEEAYDKVKKLAELVSVYSGRLELYNVNFTEIQKYIYEKCPHDELTIIMRRYMMKIAMELSKEEECQALITGESLAQVASQTMEGLACTDAVCTMPVFRPLIGLDKNDIIDIAQKIGTFETSILPYEDCCTIFVAKHPVTKPKLKRIMHSETHLFEEIDDMVQRAVDGASKYIAYGDEIE